MLDFDLDPDINVVAEASKFYNPKLTPATMSMHLDPTWIPAKHLLYISTKVATAVHNGGGRIIISLPPRHGKSRMLSIGSTVWGLETYPGYYFGLCTYGSQLSLDFSGTVRDQLERNQDKLDVRIRKGSNRIDKFLTENDGGVMAFGVGGAMTGRGFHVFFLDDYIKQLKEALSPTYRQQIWDWFVTTAFTRLEPGATVVIVATRWHDDDLIGRIIKEMKDAWEYIRIPALAEDNDPLGRAVGEALFPERYDVEALLSIKRMLGSFWFSAIYQQNPRDDESRMANKDWLQYTGNLPNPNTLTWGRIWDFAGLKNAGDYTVGLKLGADKPNYRGYITDIRRGQMSPDSVDELFKAVAKEDGKHVTIYIAQEPGASGLITTNHFKKLVPGHKVIGVPELTNKAAKAHAMLAGAERGDLLLKLAPWNECFADEFDAFPAGEHDDQIDCAAIGWNKMIGIPKASATWGRSGSDDKGDTAIRGARTAGTSVVWGRRPSGLIVPNKRTIGK